MTVAKVCILETLFIIKNRNTNFIYDSPGAKKETEAAWFSLTCMSVSFMVRVRFYTNT